MKWVGATINAIALTAALQDMCALIRFSLFKIIYYVNIISGDDECEWLIHEYS